MKPGEVIPLDPAPAAIEEASKSFVKQAQRRQAVKVPSAGLVWNPMKGYPRNEKCFCGSGKKFKKCHDGNLAQAVDPKTAQLAKEFMRDVANGRS